MACWIKPCDPNYYHIFDAMRDLKKIDWNWNSGIQVNDIVYIYVSKPIQAIRFKCKVNKVNFQELEIDDSKYVVNEEKLLRQKEKMEIEFLESYEGKELSLSTLREKTGKLDLKFQGPTRVSTYPKLQEYLDSLENPLVEESQITDQESKASADHPYSATYKINITFPKQGDNYSLDELAKILYEMCSSITEGEKKKSTVYHNFGLIYGKIIQTNRINIRQIIPKVNASFGTALPESYYREISKGIRIRNAIESGMFGFSVENVNAEKAKSKLPVLEPRKKEPNRPFYALNTIIYGAPGTGKTYCLTSRAIAIVEKKTEHEVLNYYHTRKDLIIKQNEYIESGRIQYTTFHQNFSYEDFVQGLKPVIPQNKNCENTGNLSFKYVNGIFKEIADKALNDAKNNYVLIIDEINRANISKVFGELITLIEEDKRWGEENQIRIKLPSGDDFVVPNNLYLLGTMNSSDKSISLIDAALRRRFEFEEKTPDPSLVEDEGLRDILTKLNDELKQKLGSSDLLIGHSYFIGKTITDLKDIFNKSIIPLLYEYFYDDTQKVKNVLTSILNGYHVQVDDSNKVGRIRIG